MAAETRTWGIIPAAGIGSRIQPLAFSKELLPLGTRIDDAGAERPRAVSDHLVERLVLAGASRLCFVISPSKTDILRHFGHHALGADVCYAIQPEPRGLCDAIFRALPFVDPAADLLVGLPDSVWFPREALAAVPPGELGFLLFPVAQPALFDAVDTDDRGRVTAVRTKEPADGPGWIWGALRMPVAVLAALHDLWVARGSRDEFLGPLVNAYLAQGGRAAGVRAGERYADVGTVDGYRDAQALLGRP